ncbi:MAG TPA: tetratricopeptide repeat protein, partial [Polyangiaceae bacterium]|nr:tetratricopeptide repeat protein [Polyangiaceae bacterium]
MLRLARIVSVVGGVAACVVLLGCSSGSVAASVRPSAPTAGDVLDQPGATSALPAAQCRDVQKGGRPLVVDWRPEQRGDLEVAMGQGIAVVKYDCHSLELLPDCVVDGSYGFKGVVLKQQLIRLEDADEVRANLPLTGDSIALKIGTDFGAGTTLDLATALIGNLTSSRYEVVRPELKGLCGGATHFVRGANIGAFVMQTGERAQLVTAAKIFSAGVEGSSSSRKVARTEDGSLESCKQSNADATKPPPNCGALVRVHLLPLSEAVVPTTSQSSNKPDEEVECPEGLVRRDGKCAKIVAQDAHECAPDDAADCELQCRKNQPQSCARLARLLSKQGGDVNRISDLLNKACGPEAPGACSDLAIAQLATKQALPEPEQSKLYVQASTLFERACQLGEPNGCFNLGNLYYAGRGVSENKQRAFSLFEQACNAGKAAGCINAGTMYDDGEGVTAEPPKAFALFKKACEGNEAVGCSNLAFMLGEGRGATADQAAAAQTYERACTLGSAKACEYAGMRFQRGQGVSVDLGHARKLFEQ